jgi:N-acetyl sugar amidotransferase
MDTSDPEISFNSEGVCSHCQSYKEKKRTFVLPENQRKKRLHQIVNYCKNKGQGKPYDCIIGVSGGVDSTYVAYLVKSLGLRSLAVHLDNGWNSELAVSNIKSVMARLDIELYTYVLDWEEFKSLQLAFLIASTPDSEIPSDHAIVALMRQMAAKYDLPIIWGVNFSSEAILPRAWSQGHMDWGYIKRVNLLFGTKKLRDYPHYSIWKLMYYRRFKLQRTFEILNYIDYDKEAAKVFLMKELGWRDYGGKHHESIYTRIFQSYILPVKFGYDKRKAHYSSLILAGQMTRQEALELLNEPPFNKDKIDEDINYLIKKFQITRQEFENIMEAKQSYYANLSPTFPKMISKIEKKLFSILFKFRRQLLKKPANNLSD